MVGPESVGYGEFVMDFVPFVEVSVAQDVQEEEDVGLDQEAEEHVGGHLGGWGYGLGELEVREGGHYDAHHWADDDDV